MNRKQQTQLDIADTYETTAAWCLMQGRDDAAETLLTYADELHAMVDDDEEAGA